MTTLQRWNLVATPHDDIRQGRFDVSQYAANLGDVDANLPACPEVYRDPVLFFRATHMTSALHDLLRDVSAVLAGQEGNRVLQLRTPFGGGKTHTLIALFHLARHRDALAKAGFTDTYPDPGPARVAVLPCLSLSAAQGRTIDGLHLHTLWGELAYRLGGPTAYELIRASDEQRVSPGVDLIRTLLGNTPTLLLLDEVLTYIEAAIGVGVGNNANLTSTNLGRQSQLFLQHLTEAVRALPHCALVYSLQQSIREAFGDETLLQTLDSLVSRIDAKREPVSGDDVLQVVRRRLFKDLGDPSHHRAAADAYAQEFERLTTQEDNSEPNKRLAREQANLLRQRIANAYPFHPDLLDLMYHRWGSLPSYQRTRGALQFLAHAIGALWKHNDAHALIGPADIPLEDPGTRNAFFAQVGERDSMASVLDADLVSPTARCKRVDDLISQKLPTAHALRPGTRLTRALALYSFGAKQGEDRGISRNDLLAACQTPDLSSDLLDLALQHLSETLLYIHSTQRRYRFERKPNLNKLIDDGTRSIQPHEADDHVKRALADQLGAHKAQAILWPNDHAHVPDRQARFLLAFMSPTHAALDQEQARQLSRQWVESCGTSKRLYRNNLAFAFPQSVSCDSAREAARKILSIKFIIENKSIHNLDKEQTEDLKARQDRATQELNGAVRQMYLSVFLPIASVGNAADPITLEHFPIQAHQITAGQLLDSLYKALSNRLFDTIMPPKLISNLHLGQSDQIGTSDWISGPTLVDHFFGSVQAPKLKTRDGLRQSIADGLNQGAFAYIIGASESDNHLTIKHSDIIFNPPNTTARPPKTSAATQYKPEDIDLDPGSYLLSKRFAEQALTAPPPPDSITPPPPPDSIAPPPPPDLISPPDSTKQGGSRTDGTVILPPPPITPPPAASNQVSLRFKAKGAQIFDIFKALRALSDMADESFVVTVAIDARSKKPIDRNTYETSILMALEEADVEILDRKKT